MESAHESESGQNQLEIRSEGGPAKVRLQKELFCAVKDLEGSVRRAGAAGAPCVGFLNQNEVRHAFARGNRDTSGESCAKGPRACGPFVDSTVDLVKRRRGLYAA